MIRDGLNQAKRFEQLTIQVFEEKKSLHLINKIDLLQNDLFNTTPALNESDNIKSGKLIENIQKDNLEFKNNDFEKEIKKIALSKKKG